MGPYDEDDQQDRTEKFLKSPCSKEKTFVQYRDEKMKQVQTGVFKKIVNQGFGPVIDLSSLKVVYEYSMFLQSKGNDSNLKCYFQHYKFFS